MKRALLFALLLVALPVLAAAASTPSSSPVAPQATSAVQPVVLQPEVASAVVSVGPAATPSTDAPAISPEDLKVLESSVTGIVRPFCLDSGIACSSARECSSVCGSLTCQCWGTCVYCP